MGKDMGKWKGGLFCMLLLCLALTGCIPDEFTEEEAGAQEKAAVEIFERYLEEELGDGEIEAVSVHKEEAPHQTGYHLTDFVDGHFTYQGAGYSFVVNTRTEEVYTSLKWEELKEKGTEYALDFLGISCDEILENNFLLNLYVPALLTDGENVFEDGKIGLANVLPATFTASEEDLEALFSDEDYEVKMYITYKGEEKLNREGYGSEALPGLKVLELKHMKDKAEASEKLGGIYDYMMSETLRESFQYGDRIVRYAKWEHLEEAGFHMFFESYCREDVNGEVTEKTLTAGEDIRLFVEGEQIEIVSGGETNFFLFAEELSEKEFETPAVWEFVMDNDRVRYTERIWLKDGNRYVLGGMGDRKPCVFQIEAGDFSIYMGEAAKEVLED